MNNQLLQEITTKDNESVAFNPELFKAQFEESFQKTGLTATLSNLDMTLATKEK